MVGISLGRWVGQSSQSPDEAGRMLAQPPVPLAGGKHRRLECGFEVVETLGRVVPDVVFEGAEIGHAAGTGCGVDLAGLATLAADDRSQIDGVVPRRQQGVTLL